MLGKGEKMSKEIFSSDFAMQRLVCMATWDLDRMFGSGRILSAGGAAAPVFSCQVGYCSQSQWVVGDRRKTKQNLGA